MSRVQPHDLWFPKKLGEWERRSVTIPGDRYVTVLRRCGITVIYTFDSKVPPADKPYTVTRMRGGKVLDERTFARVPRHIDQILHNPRRRRARTTGDHPPLPQADRSAA